jgi:hypothetical protein
MREALSAVASYVSRDGLVILERATRVEVDVPDVFDRVRDVRSGDSSLTLLVPRAEAP